MFVTSTKGERIGKVIRRDEDTFVVEKGTLFPKDYELRYDHIAGLSGGEISYSLDEVGQREERSPRREAREAADTRATTASLASDAPAKASPATAAPSGPRPMASAPAPAPAPAVATTGQRQAAAKSSQSAETGDREMRIPLMQEELEIEKVPQESGHVRIHKGVKTEERHFTVPVRREEIVIEHVTAFAGGAGTGEPGTFEDQVVDITLHEEEIRVTKRPVLREEIVVRTVAHSVEKEATATLRHEEADVEDTRKTVSADESRTREARLDEARREDGYGAPRSR
jgi:uncharacterized protein (TIGR02271 family)